MKKLQQKIKNLNRAMNKDNQKIADDRYVLRSYTKSPTFIACEIAGGFVAGYWLARKKRVLEALVILYRTQNLVNSLSSRKAQ